MTIVTVTTLNPYWKWMWKVNFSLSHNLISIYGGDLHFHILIFTTMHVVLPTTYLGRNVKIAK